MTWRHSFPRWLREQAGREGTGILILGYVTEKGGRGERIQVATDEDLRRVLRVVADVYPRPRPRRRRR